MVFPWFSYGSSIEPLRSGTLGGSGAGPAGQQQSAAGPRCAALRCVGARESGAALPAASAQDAEPQTGRVADDRMR